MPPTPKLKGNRFGRLVVIAKLTKRRRQHVVWRCRCDCGKETEVVTRNLTHGITKSCGCLWKERIREANTKHGLWRENKQEYKAWWAARERCTNPNHPQFKDYGARNIKMCKRWKNSFAKFLKDMGTCPMGNTLERLDNDKGYFPNNCKWASRKDQSRNRRSTKLSKGKIKNIKTLYDSGHYTQKDLAWMYNVDPSTISYVLSGRVWR